MPFSVQTTVRLTCTTFLLMCLSTRALFADVIVTRLANGGVILSDGQSTSVMIDGMVTTPFSIYAGLPDDARDKFFKAIGPFLGIDLALVSHQHHQHNQPDTACAFLRHSPDTVFASSSQVIDLVREKCRDYVTTSKNVQIIDPQYDQPVTLHAGDATVTVFLLSHGHGRNSTIVNFGHLVEIGGMKVLHVGGADMDPTDFARAGVDKMNIDVALVPFLFYEPGPGPAVVATYLNSPHQIAEQIPPDEMADVKSYLQVEYPQVLILENALEQVRFTAPSRTLQ
ncbi:MAG: MBL fold metallo-hydrolase [Lysobacterales bacterium]